MRRGLVLALLLGGSVGSGGALAQSESAPAPSSATARFPAGETLVYEARFGIFTVGKALLHVAGIDTVRGTPSLHVVFVLQGGLPIYRLHNRMDSWIGVDDFASRRFIQDFHEGGSDRYTAYEIYPDSAFYTEHSIEDDGVAGELERRETSPDPLDDLAFFYFVRASELEVGQRYEFQRYFRPDRNPVVLDVAVRDTLDVPAGRFPSLVVHPVIQGRGILAESREPRMWISDDERRLVVQLKSKFPFGTITLRLKEITDTPPTDMLPPPEMTRAP